MKAGGGGVPTFWDALGRVGGFRLRLLLLAPSSSQAAGAYDLPPALLPVLELPASEAKSSSGGAPSLPPPCLGAALNLGDKLSRKLAGLGCAYPAPAHV